VTFFFWIVLLLSFLVHNTHLKALSASGHAVPPSAIWKFGKSLALPTNALKEIAIGNHEMGDEGVVALCEPLHEQGGNLEKIDLAYKGISQRGMVAIGQTFYQSLQLRELNLSRNPNIGNEGIQQWRSACNSLRGGEEDNHSRCFEALDVLDLSECGIGPTGMDALASMLRAKKKLRILKLHRNPLGSASAGSLSHLLVGDPSTTYSKIQSLHLGHCELGDDGLATLTQVANPRTGLEVLDLSDNGIGHEGMTYFAKSLHDGCWSTLVELSMAGNPLGPEGVKALANALENNGGNHHHHHGGEKTQITGNASVEILDMSRTQCGIDGVQWLWKCTGLVKLRLFDNALGSGLEELVSTRSSNNGSKEEDETLLFSSCSRLQELDLGGNNAPSTALVALLDAIAAGKTKLRVLELGGNQGGENVEEAIKRLQRKIPNLDVARDRPHGSHS